MKSERKRFRIDSVSIIYLLKKYSIKGAFFKRDPAKYFHVNVIYTQ